MNQMQSRLDIDPPIRDNFFTPSNYEFYASSPYLDLDTSVQEIRLLQLVVVNDDEPIQGRLVTTKLLHANSPRQSYCAISYCAGSHKDTDVIFVNKVRFNAFASLVHALRQVYRAWREPQLRACPQYIWADQVCIDQSNLRERSHQVSFMRVIYANAHTVFACLGPDPSNGACVLAAKRLHAWPLDGDVMLNGDNVVINDHEVASFEDKSFQQDWSSLADLLSRPWWRRGWIYQEVLVASQIVLLYGQQSLDWESFAHVTHLMDKVLQTAVCQFMGVGSERVTSDNRINGLIGMAAGGDYAMFLIDGRRKWQNGEEENIVGLLQHAKDCNVTDLRDRIFAFTGLANPGYRILPDYTISESTVYRYTAKRIMLFDNKLNILTCCQGTFQEGKRRKDIPSWTPDWSIMNESYEFFYDAVQDHPPFRASEDYWSAAAFLALNQIPNTVLRVQCLVVDRVESESSMRFRPDYSPEMKYIDMISELEQEYGGSGLYLDESLSLTNALWQVLWRGLARHHRQDDYFYAFMRTATQESIQRGRFFRSSKGYLGITKIGAELLRTDLICVLLGANVPFILRKVDEHYILLSDAYVEGLMYGEAIKMMRDGVLTVETIDIR